MRNNLRGVGRHADLGLESQPKLLTQRHVSLALNRMKLTNEYQSSYTAKCKCRPEMLRHLLKLILNSAFFKLIQVEILVSIANVILLTRCYE